MYVAESEEYSGISIITDARHGWRKNSKQTDVPCIGHSTHKFLCDQIITKQDDPVFQRHEGIGTDRIYECLSYLSEKAMAKITKASKHGHGKTWRSQLNDKSASIRTHVHWAIRNYQHNEQILRDNMINIVQHYSNVHDDRSVESRCKKDQI